MAYYTLLRVSEFAAPSGKRFSEATLLVSDVELSEWGIKFNIKTAKTDPFHHRATITVGRNNSPLCPKRAAAEYIELRGSKPGPFFQYQNGVFLSTRLFNKLISNALPANSQGTYSSHSFRIGGATSLASRGYSADVIQYLGRWASDSYKKYIRFSNEDVQNIYMNMGRHQKYKFLASGCTLNHTLSLSKQGPWLHSAIGSPSHTLAHLWDLQYQGHSYLHLWTLYCAPLHINPWCCMSQ